VESFNIISLMQIILDARNFKKRTDDDGGRGWNLTGKTFSFFYSPRFCLYKSLDHLLEKAIDELFPISEVTTLREVVGLFAPTAASIVQLEVPKEIVGDFKVGSDGKDFVNEILHADDSELAQSLFDDFVGEGATTTLELAKSAFVNELAHRFEVGISPGDVRIGDSQHAQRSLVQLDKGSVVNLTESQQLQDLPDSWVKSVDTPNPHDDGEFGFGGNVEVAMFARVTSHTDLVGLRTTVFLDILLSAFEDGRTLGLGLLFIEKRSFNLFGAEC